MSVAPPQIGTRDELMVAMEDAVRPGEPRRLVAIFRLGGYEQFTILFGDTAISTTATDIAQQLPITSGASPFYYRPRQDELCVFVEGPLELVERALLAAAAQVNTELGPNGIAIGYGTAVVPQEMVSLIEALMLVDSRVVDAVGKLLRRSYRTDFMTLRGNVPLEANREDWSLRIRESATTDVVGLDARPSQAA